ncbi:MAG: iron chaperone [Bacilli bacterium]
MNQFINLLKDIPSIENQTQVDQLFKWILSSFSHLKLELKWNQPMFTDHNTFILGFSFSKKHLAVAPEKHTIDLFRKKLEENGYESSSMVFRIKWGSKIDYDLLTEIINYNIKTKEKCETFWRK